MYLKRLVFADEFRINMMRIECLLCCFSVFKSVLSMSGPDSQGPMFISEPRSNVEFSNDVGTIIPCTAHGSPDPIITWLMADGSTVTPVLHIREITKNGSLYFPPFGAESYRHDVHSTGYRCEASNSVGRILSREVNVKAVVKQHYDVIVRDTYVLSGNTAVLRCEVPSFVKDHVSITSWIQDSSFNIYPSPYAEGKHHMLPSGELLVYSVTDSDSRPSYRCRTVHHITGKTIESSTYGRVTLTENREKVPPRNHEKVSPNPIREGEVAVLSCVSQGYPPPNYWWFKSTSGSLEPLLPSERMHMRDGVLILQNAQINDSGRYVCKANNTAGSERVELQLTILVPLSVHLTPQHVTVDIGHDTELTCSISGHPTPTITWRKDSLPLRDTSHRIRMTGHLNSRLQITRVGRDDRGMYQCFAKNDYEMSQGTAELRLGDALPQLMYKFIEQTMQPGPSVSLKCIAAGNPTPQFTWTLDGFALPQSDRLVIGQYVTVHGDVISHVNISSVRVEDGGEYRCTAKNRVGSAGHSARLNIYGLPLVRPMNTIAAVAGHDLVLQCPVAGYPISSITWEKDGQLLPMNRRQEVSSNGTLVIHKVDSSSDKGLYTCLARNKQGHHDSKSVQIEVKVPPKIEHFSFPSDIQQGSRVLVTCVVSSGDQPLKLEWLFDGNPILPDGVTTYTHSEDDLSLRIASASPNHSGNYTCVARNQAAEVSHQAALIVHVPPRWSVPPENQQAPQGAHGFVLDCQAEGNPTPTVTWRRGIGSRPGQYRDLAQQEHGSGMKVFTNGSLYIERLREEHEGYYLCEAFNGIGTGLSKRIYLTVNAPAHFVSRHRNHTARLGSSATLRCEAKGDRPIKIIWRKAGSSLEATAADYRYSSKITNATDGVVSEFTISNTLRDDSGRYHCTATNAFGRDEMTLQLFIQEPPDFPRNVHVIEKGSRFVKLGWVLSQDGNSPIIQCIVEYKTESESWHKQTTQTTVPANQATVLISSLRPAVNYQFRLFAENELGKSQASDILDVTTDSEVPSGAPRNLQVEAMSATELHVIWDAPERDLWNGEILGYHVGFKEQRLKEDQYQFKNVESRGAGSGGETSLTDLKKFTKYSIVVQAYNALGPGPTSSEVLAVTLEDVPSAAPQDIRCAAFTSQSLQVSWSPVPDTQLHGHLKGYKLVWENLEDLDVSNKPETKKTTALSVVIHGLEKFTNYSVQVLAFTNAGDGVSSSPLHCLTNEDVPEVPSAIKAVVSSPSSIVVSWLPPTRINGILTSYNLQIRSVGGPNGGDSKPKRHSIPPHNTHYEEEGLNKRLQYEFTVAAVTKVGEGPRTQPVTLSPTTEVRAAIYSFGSITVLPWKNDARLPCRSVGKTEPEWSLQGQQVSTTGRYKILNDGSLQMVNLIRNDSGNYTCKVENRYGSDAIIHRLTVQVPPASPFLHATSATSSSLNVQWRQGDDGGAPIRGYHLHFKRENGEWDIVQVGRQQNNYILNDLFCGTPYQIYVVAFNHIGKGDKSQTVSATTDGSKPTSVPKESFLVPNATYVTLYLENWLDNGCPILYFEVEIKRADESDFTVVSNSLEKQKHFLLKNLQPGTEYVLKVKAHNNAGSAEAAYRFFTLRKVGGTVSPSLTRHSGQTEIPFYLDLRLVLPLFVSCLAVFSAVLAVYYCLNKRPILGETLSLRESQSSAALDNKQNMQHREQYYATVRKPLRSPVREIPTLERIPEYSEDIYPYATFQLNQTSAGGETRCTSGAPMRESEDLDDLERERERGTPLQTFLYHDPLLTTAETLQLRESDCGKSKNNHRGGRRKSKSFKSESEEYDYDSLGSDTEAENSGTEQGVSSRTESSNQLDGPMSQSPGFVPGSCSIQNKERSSSQLSRHRSRMHNFIYHGPESSTSTEPSPVFEKKSFPRSRGRSKMLQLARYSFEAPRAGSGSATPRAGSSTPFGSSSPFLFKLEPPTGFSDSVELSEAECDRPSKLSAYRSSRQQQHPSRDFTIAV